MKKKLIISAILVLLLTISASCSTDSTQYQITPSTTPICLELTPPPLIQHIAVADTALEHHTATVDYSVEAPPPSRSAERDLDGVKYITMTATTYDLSYASCKKNPDHPEYGITFSGKRATVNRTVATDPKVIPLGTEMYIKFPSKYDYLDGVYVAEDIGSAIKGNRVDVFIGESAYEECMEFGLQEVKVYILEETSHE
jgi:3D (Asp-Asp-Asp) domain-containing protein